MAGNATALRINTSDRQVGFLRAAREALVQAQTVREVKQIRDAAAAAEIYATRQKLSDEAIGFAHALKIEAQAKLGALLKQLAKHKGGRPQTGSSKEPVNLRPTLADLGLDKKTSMEAQQLANLPVQTQRAIAAREKTLKQAIKEHVQATSTRPPLPDGTFRVIYADPPWQYGNEAHGASAAGHYPTMEIADICAIDVKSRAADDAVLFMWTTSPLLFAYEPVFQAWGFTYKAAIIWDKVRGVCGSYVDVRHELLLISTRGFCVPDRLTPAIDSVQTIQKSRVHSQKPDEFYEIIERLYDGPYLELFARRPRAGWTSFGNDPALTEVA